MNLPGPWLRRAFHASACAPVRQKYLKKINRLHKHWAKELFRPQPEWVDPVLGRPQVAFLARVRAELSQPLGQIDHLEPETTARLLHGAGLAAQARLDSQDIAAPLADAERHQREAVSRIVSLSNAPSSQLRKRAVQLARAEFQRFEGDTGSPEVQAAVATIKIQFMAQHVKATKKDVGSKRKLEHAVQTRRNLLLYLKRTDPRRYMWAIEKLGLTDEAVAAEFHLSRKYLFKTQFYGDRTLPLPKTKKDTRAQRKLNARKEKAMRYVSQSNPDMLL